MCFGGDWCFGSIVVGFMGWCCFISGFGSECFVDFCVCGYCGGGELFVGCYYW